jgi:osmotically inducible protein OsmC
MGIVKQTASVVWQGSIARGRGQINGGSGAIAEVPVTLASRLGNVEGLTSPEELIAAAHASCFSMALSHGLGEAGTPPERLDVSATVTLEVGTGITSSRLVVRGRVPGIDQAKFEEAARAAKDGCPVSGALKGNLDIQVEATLET